MQRAWIPAPFRPRLLGSAYQSKSKRIGSGDAAVGRARYDLVSGDPSPLWLRKAPLRAVSRPSHEPGGSQRINLRQQQLAGCHLLRCFVASLAAFGLSSPCQDTNDTSPCYYERFIKGSGQSVTALPNKRRVAFQIQPAKRQAQTPESLFH